MILENPRRPARPANGRAAFPSPITSGPATCRAHMKLAMDYQQRPIYDVIAKLHGANDDEWVCSATIMMRGFLAPPIRAAAPRRCSKRPVLLASCARSGWKPRRTIVICQWDAEEPGLIGSTEWVEANRAELQAKAVAYINTDVGVTGSEFRGFRHALAEGTGARRHARSAGPARRAQRLRCLARTVPRASRKSRAVLRRLPSAKFDGSGRSPRGSAWARARTFLRFSITPGFLRVDLGFGGDYGVYHSLYDDFYWMKHFGDPTFVFTPRWRKFSAPSRCGWTRPIFFLLITPPMPPKFRAQQMISPLARPSRELAAQMCRQFQTPPPD